MSGADAQAFCLAFKDEVGKAESHLTTQQSVDACKQRMPEAACRKCLGLP